MTAATPTEMENGSRVQTAADFRMAERLRWLACGAAVGAGVSALLAAYLRRRPRRKRIYVSGCFDLLHSGHVAFFKEAAQLGDLYVSVGNDACGYSRVW